MKLKALFALAAVGTLLIGPLPAEDKAKKKDPLKGIKCLMSGKQVVDCSVGFKGGKVYFCGGKCATAFEADLKKEPADRKFTAKANHQLYATKQAKLVQCAFTCKKLNSETVIEIAGTKVCFCCAKCKKKAEDAEDPVQAVFNDKQFKNGFKIAKKKEGKKAKKK